MNLALSHSLWLLNATKQDRSTGCLKLVPVRSRRARASPVQNQRLKLKRVTLRTKRIVNIRLLHLFWRTRWLRTSASKKLTKSKTEYKKRDATYRCSRKQNRRLDVDNTEISNSFTIIHEAVSWKRTMQWSPVDWMTAHVNCTEWVIREKHEVCAFAYVWEANGRE